MQSIHAVPRGVSALACLNLLFFASSGDEPAENGGIVPVEVPAGMFSQRELYMAKREADGDLAFEYVDNDNTANHNMW